MTFTWTRTMLRCLACGASWEAPKDEPHECAVAAARSQADALAEALEEYAEQIERHRREPDLMRIAANSMRRTAAAYRSSSSEDLTT